MTKFRKIITVILIVCFAMIPISSIAKNNNENLSKKDLEIINEQKRIVKEISEGGHTIIGEPTILYSIIQSTDAQGTDISIQWIGKGIDFTTNF